MAPKQDLHSVKITWPRRFLLALRAAWGVFRAGQVPQECLWGVELELEVIEIIRAPRLMARGRERDHGVRELRRQRRES